MHVAMVRALQSCTIIQASLMTFYACERIDVEISNREDLSAEVDTQAINIITCSILSFYQIGNFGVHLFGRGFEP